MNRKLLIPVLFLLLSVPSVWVAAQDAASDGTIFTAIKDILESPARFDGKLVSVKAGFQGWKSGAGAPPVTRSDWVAEDVSGGMIYCTGNLPGKLRPDDPSSIGRKVTILGTVARDQAGRPFLTVTEALPFEHEIEPMVAVSQILFDPLGSKGKKVVLVGVLAKGFGHKGNRIYFLADPTGAITLGRLPKLYPKGTILQLKGTIGTDENGLPILDNLEIVSAKP